jgi:hypothetical protein
VEGREVRVEGEVAEEEAGEDEDEEEEGEDEAEEEEEEEEEGEDEAEEEEEEEEEGEDEAEEEEEEEEEGEDEGGARDVDEEIEDATIVEPPTRAGPDKVRCSGGSRGGRGTVGVERFWREKLRSLTGGTPWNKMAFL